MKRNKGFTLIELLVVIAIIGILSAIVLASLNSARTKATDAKVQAQMSSIRGAAEIAYDGVNAKYGNSTSVHGCEGLTGNAALSSLMATASWSDGVAPVCVSNTTTATGAITAWAMSHAWGTTFWCVDSTGASKSISAALTPTTFLNCSGTAM